jgi:hypothetical protein
VKLSHWLTTVVVSSVAMLLIVALGPQPVQAAYQHMGEADSGNFVAVHPEKAGTKLDSCSLCHGGGAVQVGGKPMSVGSCQWCHTAYGYDGKGDISQTLNPYGKDYLAYGRTADAVKAIESLDSDGDGFSNSEEIAATRYPGDPNDDPTKVPAPFRVYARDQLEKLPQYTEFMLMNASKSTDYYADYTGVPMEDFLRNLILPSATGITVYSPDGFSQYHPLNPEPLFYQLFGTYPPAKYFYSEQADIAKSPSDGWADYSAPGVAGRNNGDAIATPAGLKMLLAIKRDGKYLAPGVLDSTNKLDGEGPFRVVPPQLINTPPDQRSNAKNQGVVWPYDANADHNAGFSTRSTTIIRVEPLPEGTTDIDVLEAGWGYVDQDKIVVYGAIDPVPTILDKLDQMIAMVNSVDAAAFNNESDRAVLAGKVEAIKQQVTQGEYPGATQRLLEDVEGKLAGKVRSQDDGWFANRDVEKNLYWSASDIVGLLKIAF